MMARIVCEDHDYVQIVRAISYNVSDIYNVVLVMMMYRCLCYEMNALSALGTLADMVEMVTYGNNAKRRDDTCPFNM